MQRLSIAVVLCCLVGAVALPTLPKQGSVQVRPSRSVAPRGEVEKSVCAIPKKSVATLPRGGAAAAPASTLKIGFYFFVWYLFNIGYNIYNKKSLNYLNLPWTTATLQLAAGLLYILPAWGLGLRKAPKLSWENIKTLIPIALMHAMAHMTAVISLNAGAVSFTHIVKAAEPAFTSLFAALFLKQYFAAPVYLSLIPVMAGVGIASLKERSFSWLSFSMAMAANTAAAARGIFAKRSMGLPKGENMDAANLYAVLTIIGTIILAPISLAVEGLNIKPVWDAAVKAGHTPKELGWLILAAGLTFYLYNEVAFLALDSVHPITHAVGNTIKRVVIIGASIVVFKNPVTTQGYVGSAIAILGVLLYSVAQEKCKKK